MAAAAVVAALLVRRRAPGGAGAALVAAAAAVAGTLLLWLPFAVVAGPGELWEVFVAGSAREGEFWSLPFPLVYDGPLRAWPPGDLATDVKDLLGYELPLAGVVALAAAVLSLRRALSPCSRACSCSALGMAVYLFSRPDEQHAQPLLIAACAFVPIALAARPARPLAAVLAVAFALLLDGRRGQPAVRARAPARPRARAPRRRARHPRPARTRRARCRRMAALVQRLVPPGEPIYVAPRRSDLVTLSAPLVHFLVDRPNLLDDDVLLQARPAEQQRIVAALRREPAPRVVRWTDPLSSRPEPNARGRPSGSRALDEHLASAYRLRARFGAYDVLVPR